MRVVRSGSRPMWQQLSLPEHVIQREVQKYLRNTGGYESARKNRRGISEWDPMKGTADTSLLPDLDTLRARSRDLERNNPLAAGALRTKLTNVIGTGFKLVPNINRKLIPLPDDELDELENTISAEWSLFTTHECDLERVSTFDELCRITYNSQKRDGDIFTLLPLMIRPGSPYATKIQLIEADRVSNPDFISDSPTLSGGVEKIEQTGEVVAYWVTDRHPHDVNSAGAVSWSRIPAFGERTGVRNVLHIFDKRRIGQSRGIPDLAPVIEPLKMLARLSEAELMGSVVSSMFTVFIKSETGDATLAPMAPTSETGGKASDEDYKLGSGAILELAEGEDIVQAAPSRPNNAFDPFVLAILRQIGIGLEIPFEMLVKHFQSSYSAARGAMLEAWRYFMAERSWFVKDFCQPVYERFFMEGVARGRIPARGFINGDPLIMYAYTRARWIGNARGQIDEKKEVEAAQLRVNAGFSTMEEETAALTGASWSEKVEQRSKEERLKQEAGITALPSPEPSEPGEEDEDE